MFWDEIERNGMEWNRTDGSRNEMEKEKEEKEVVR